jgi:hypothetical protein
VSWLIWLPWIDKLTVVVSVMSMIAGLANWQRAAMVMKLVQQGNDEF